MQTSKQIKRLEGNWVRLERTAPSMSGIFRKYKPPAVPSHFRQPGYLSVSSPRLQSSTIGSPIRSSQPRASNAIIVLRNCVISRPSEADTLCVIRNAHTSHMSMDIRVIIALDRVLLTLGHTQPLSICAMDLRPSTNSGQLPISPPDSDQALRALLNSWRNSDALPPPKSLFFSPDPRVRLSLFHLILLLINSGSCSFSSALPKLVRPARFLLKTQLFRDPDPFNSILGSLIISNLSGFILRAPSHRLKPQHFINLAPFKVVSGSLNSSALSVINPQATSMEDKQGQPSNQGPNRDPLGNLFNSKECNMCMAHTIMINSVKKQLKELTEDYHADRESKRKKLGKRKKEIEDLKDRCIHMEAVIDHLRTLTESNQAEASTRASAQKEDSATPHFP